jgi:hypothetical protein
LDQNEIKLTSHIIFQIENMHQWRHAAGWILTFWVMSILFIIKVVYDEEA